ncbi:hypothetical protein [Halocola ammonii]
MKQLLTILMTCLPYFLYAQETWNQVFVNPSIDVEGVGPLAPSAMYLEDNHISILAEGAFCFTCDNPWRLMFLRYDYGGNLLDSTLYPTSDDGIFAVNGWDHFYGTFKNTNNEIVSLIYHRVSGSDIGQNSNYSLYHFNQDLDILGNIQLTEFSGGNSNGQHYIFQKGIQFNEHYILAGYTQPDSSTTIEDDRGFITAIDPETGDSLWYKEYPDLFDIHKVYNFNDGFIWALGSQRFPNADVPGGDLQYYLMKLDDEGNLLKIEEFGGVGGEGEFRTVHLIKEEDRILVGGLISNDPYIEDIGGDRGTYTTIIYEETENGFEEVQLKRYGVNYNYQQVNGFFPVDEDSTYMMYGYYRTSTTPYQQGYLLNLSYEMDSLWSRKYIYYDSQEADHFIRYLKPAPDGGYIGCGFVENAFEDPFPGIEQLWLFRTDEYGCLEPGC